jgi:hypothetical protein
MNRPTQKKTSRKAAQCETQKIYAKYAMATLALSRIHNAIGDTEMELAQDQVVAKINELMGTASLLSAGKSNSPVN